MAAKMKNRGKENQVMRAPSDPDNAWKKFKQDYDKKYISQEDELLHRLEWENDMRNIKEHNAQYKSDPENVTYQKRACFLSDRPQSCVEKVRFPPSKVRKGDDKGIPFEEISNDLGVLCPRMS